jgi:purine-binding chemotaxis protein CheW
MEFRIGGQLYAVPLLTVKEVIQKPDVTLVPNMPAHFEGMINLRGQILGVFNVRRKLGAKQKESVAAQGTGDVVIVVEQLGVSVGMTVDEVTRVLHAKPDSIGPAPLKEDDPAHGFISSIIQTGEDLVQTLNLAELLELAKYSGALKTAA